jgi:hypothetical protein
MLFPGVGHRPGLGVDRGFGVWNRWSWRICPTKRATYEDYVGLKGLKRLGKKKWRKEVAEVVKQFKAATQAEYVVLGGGNAG